MGAPIIFNIGVAILVIGLVLWAAPSQFTEMEVAINACQKSSKELEALIKEYKGDDPNKKLPWED
jgi:hypothetical protein